MTLTTALILLTIAFTVGYVLLRLFDVLTTIKTAVNAKKEIDKRRQETLERTAEVLISSEKAKDSINHL